ncbi:TolC family protein, partial [candidate division KSB1 bacterium]|nr:TolC family protein [candidate division KSB1 bacterium]
MKIKQNKTFQIKIILYLMMLSTISLQAGENLQLVDCLKLAYQKSYLLKATAVDNLIADEKVATSKSQRLPSVNLTSLYTRIGKITSFSIPMGPGGESRTFQFGTPNRVNLDLKFQLPVLTWGRINSTIGLAESGRSMTAIQDRQEKIKLTDQVLRSFYLAAFHQELIKLNEATVKRAENLLKITAERFEAGLVPRLELLRAQVQLKNTQSQLQESQDNHFKSKIMLEKLLGLDAEVISLAADFKYQRVNLNADEILNEALAIRSELMVFKIQEELNEHQVRLANSTNKPNLFVFSGYNITNGFDPMEPNRFVDNWNAGVQLVVPLFDGFSTKHQVQQAKLQRQVIELQIAEIRDLIQMQVRQALVSLNQAANKIDVLKANVALALEALQVADTQYQEGLASSLDVLNAQQALSQSEL